MKIVLEKCKGVSKYPCHGMGLVSTILTVNGGRNALPRSSRDYMNSPEYVYVHYLHIVVHEDISRV